MNLQCVDQRNVFLQPPPPSNSLPFDAPAYELDYEVAELTWENGQLAMHALCPPRQLYTKPVHDGRGGTLESLVDQATRIHHTYHMSGDFENHDLQAPWFVYHRDVDLNSRGGGGGVSMDALVPCDNNNNNNDDDEKGKSTNETCDNPEHVPGIRSCSGATCQQTTTLDTSCDRDRQPDSFTLMTTSAENTNSGAGKEYTKTSGDDHDWVSPGQSQREGMCRKKCGSGKSSTSTKTSRAAAIHNQSERKRRDRINERMKTLQKLVPNSSKTDKASMLDEVIEYLKQLQTQVQLMSRMVPLAMQHLHMSMMAPMSGMGLAGMGMGMGMGMGIPPLPLQPSWDNTARDPFPVFPDPFFACQSSQATSMEAYGRLVALFQQLQR